MTGALVIGGTKKDWEAMAVFLLNFKMVMPNTVEDIIVFHDGITKKQQKLMNNVSKIKFVRYICPISKLKCLKNKSVRYFSRMVFCKYECFRLLKEYDFVVWSDYDVVLKESIAEIIDTQCGFKTVCNEEIPLRENLLKKITNRDILKYDLLAESICTPLFVLHRNIGDYTNYYSWCYKQTKKYINDLYLPEQAIISMLVQKYNIDYEKIDRRVYCSHPSNDKQDIKVLHAYGQPKFWNGLDNKIWNNYYQKWQEMKE